MKEGMHIADQETLSLRRTCFNMFGDDKELSDAVSFTVSSDPSSLAAKGADYYLELAKKCEKGENKNPKIAGAHYWNQEE